MDQDRRIADLRAMLTVKREQRDECYQGRIDMPGSELRRLERSIRDDEEALRRLGVDDV